MQRIHALLMSISIFFTSACNKEAALPLSPQGAPSTVIDKLPASPQEDMTGLWVVDYREDIMKATDGPNLPMRIPQGRPFYFHGDSLTLKLSTEKEWMWRTDDGYYRVKTKWVGNTLYWLPPFGSWEDFESAEHGIFINRRPGMRYVRVEFEDTPVELQPFLKARELHDYAITPTGGRDPKRLLEQ